MNLTEALTDLLASPGPHLIAIDGPAGSGKSTLAKDLYLYYSATRDVNLLGLDDIYDGWDNALGQKLTNDLEKMAQAHADKTSFSVPIYNWATSSYGDVRDVEAREILIIEGVGSCNISIREKLTTSIWLDIDQQVGLTRVLARDGEAIRNEMVKWQEMESKYFAKDLTRESADFILSTQ